MPGFNVPGAGGGHKNPMNSRLEYYYNYFWQVTNLFENLQESNSPLIALRDASLPTFTVNKEPVHGASLEYKYAKSITWDDIKLTWYDSVGLFDVMRKWRESVWTSDCGIADPNDYKKQSLLYYYLPTGLKGNSWVLYNSWPSQIRHGELTYTTGDLKLIEATITYDWAQELPAK